jgi:hypothetical protein
MSNKFECNTCGSQDLAIRRYAKCLIPVVIKDDGTCEYLEAVVDSDDYIDGEDYFCCFNCQKSIENNDLPVQTEKELLEFINTKILIQERL